GRGGPHPRPVGRDRATACRAVGTAHDTRHAGQRTRVRGERRRTLAPAYRPSAGTRRPWCCSSTASSDTTPASVALGVLGQDARRVVLAFPRRTGRDVPHDGRGDPETHPLAGKPAPSRLADS